MPKSGKGVSDSAILFAVSPGISPTTDTVIKEPSTRTFDAKATVAPDLAKNGGTLMLVYTDSTNTVRTANPSLKTIEYWSPSRSN